MAKCKVTFPDGLLADLDALAAATDDIIDDAVEAGAEIARAAVYSELKAVIGQGTKDPSHSTGELLASLGKTPLKISRTGVHNVKIGFAEPRRDGESNAKIANVIEYGKSGQPAKPFLARAKRKCRQSVVDAMARVWKARVQQ
jgi:HK97 gp10 family phage protein